MLPRLRWLLRRLALRLLSVVLAVSGTARLVAVPLPVLLLAVAAIAMARLSGGLLPARVALVPLRLGLARRRVKR